MATLVISHSIHLTKKQRYDLNDNKKVETIGVSTPIWFDKGSTSEPAKEIFCKYFLTNYPEERAIVPLEDGYVINMPQHLSEDNEKMPVELLLDEKDGGEKYLTFKQVSRVSYLEKEFEMVNLVVLSDEQELLQSIS